MEESQRDKKVLGALNSIFLTLIPMKKNPSSFKDFRPISCCNVVYKIIAKIIAQQLKQILSEIITKEQFGFLFNCQIHDVVSLSQEAIHTIKHGKSKAFALKLDLSKSYDRVNWTFLRLVMIQIRMDLETFNWIMGYVQSVSFAVLINGSPSNFFRSSRGLGQGCPLSPFLFLLIVDDLSIIIHQYEMEGSYKGVMVTNSEELSQILFVDDVIMMGEGTWENIKEAE